MTELKFLGEISLKCNAASTEDMVIDVRQLKLYFTPTCLIKRRRRGVGGSDATLFAFFN